MSAKTTPTETPIEKSTFDEATFQAAYDAFIKRGLAEGWLDPIIEPIDEKTIDQLKALDRAGWEATHASKKFAPPTGTCKDTRSEEERTVERLTIAAAILSGMAMEVLRGDALAMEAAMEVLASDLLDRSHYA